MRIEYIELIINKMIDDIGNEKKLKRDFKTLYNLMPKKTKVNKAKLSKFIKAEVDDLFLTNLLKLFFYQNKDDFIDYIYECIEDNFSSSIENERSINETIRCLL